MSITKGRLNKIFRPKPNWTTVSGMELAVEAKKFHAELIKGDNLMKFLYLHLAPDHLQSKIKEIIRQDIEKFKARFMDICDTSYQEQKNGFPPFQQ